MRQIYPAITNCFICYLVRLQVAYPSDFCLCLETHGSNIYYHMGNRKSVNQSNLCSFNEKRDYRINYGLGIYLIDIVRICGDFIIPPNRSLEKKLLVIL